MSQKGENHVSTERKDGISLILTPKNYVPWSKEAVLVCGKLYGRLADVLTTGKPYKVPVPVEKDYLPEQEPGEPALSQSQKDKLFERAYERYYAKLDKTNDNKPLMYFTLMGSIGTESKNIISQSARYLDHCDKNKDSDELAIIVRKTHYTEVSGDNPLRKYNTRAKAEMRFGLFKMKSDMTLGDFFEQFVEHRRILTAQKDEVPHPKREAQNFLLRLDERYAEMLVSMDNGSITGKAYPGSLEEAYEVTRLWAIPTHKKVATSATALVVSEEGSRARDGGGRGSRGGSGRGTSGRGGRGPSKRGSPSLKLLKKTVKFVKEEPKGTEKADTTGWVVPPGCEPVSKTCRGCLKKGHIWINCPDNTTSEKVLVGKENDEDDWEEADEEEDWRTYVIAESRDRQSTMFLSDEILLDN